MRTKLKNLVVYHEALELSKECFEIGIKLRQNHHYVLSDQLERSGISIPSNIAEGAAWGSDKMYLKHIRVAIGSAFELDTQLELVKVVLSDESVKETIERLSKVIARLYGLKKYLTAQVGEKSF